MVKTKKPLRAFLFAKGWGFMTMAYWPSVRSRPPSIQREFRGINKLDPFSLDERFATSTKNRTLDGTGQHVTRPGFSLVGSALSSPSGIGVWKDTELHAIVNGEWLKYSGGAWGSPIVSGLGTGPASFCNYKGNLADINLIMANGSGVKRYDGTAVQTLTDAPAAGNYITAFSNRLWVALGNEIRASSLDKADEWNIFTDDAGSFGKDMESPSGETICALAGGLAKLTIGFPNSLHELYGGVPSDFATRMVVDGIGPVNNRSMLAVNGIMYILHTTGLYQYSGGVLPSKAFSLPIQDYIDKMNQSALSTCAIGTDGQRLFISIPTGSSAVPDTIIEYHLTNNTWFVWKDMSARYFANMDNQLYIAEGTRVIASGGSSDAGTAINWDWVSKPLTAPSMSQTIRFLRLWVTVSLPVGSTLEVSLSKSVSGDDWESVGAITASSDIQRKPIYVASSKVANAKQLRYRLSGTGAATIHEIAWEQDVSPLR